MSCIDVYTTFSKVVAGSESLCTYKCISVDILFLVGVLVLLDHGEKVQVIISRNLFVLFISPHLMEETDSFFGETPTFRLQVTDPLDFSVDVSTVTTLLHEVSFKERRDIFGTLFPSILDITKFGRFFLESSSDTESPFDFSLKQKFYLEIMELLNSTNNRGYIQSVFAAFDLESMKKFESLSRNGETLTDIQKVLSLFLYFGLDLVSVGAVSRAFVHEILSIIGRLKLNVVAQVTAFISYLNSSIFILLSQNVKNLVKMAFVEMQSEDFISRSFEMKEVHMQTLDKLIFVQSQLYQANSAENVSENSSGQRAFKYRNIDLKSGLVMEKPTNGVIPHEMFFFDFLEDMCESEHIFGQFLHSMDDNDTPNGMVLMQSFNLFPSALKAKILSHENTILQQSTDRKELCIDRNNLLRSAINQLVVASSADDISGRFRIKFMGEAGIDEGGLIREFFQLITDELLDPSFFIFEQEENNLMWINPVTFEDNMTFQLIGILMGIAISNDVTVNFQFPIVFYKKLLGRPVFTEDFREIKPVMYDSIMKLREFTAEEIEATYLTFDVIHDFPGSDKIESLIPGGSEIRVTKENVDLYIDKLISYYLNDSISDKFNAIRFGFEKVMCKSKMIGLFHPEELEKLICGLPNYNVEELISSFKYVDFEKDCEAMVYFFGLLRSFDIEEMKRFLKFITGSDRIPIGGFNSRPITLRRVGNQKALPVAHTCQLLLDIPGYPSQEICEAKVRLALQHCDGFHLI
ncbi:hypothetical protein PCE1_004165 [Barthelona sp. PCE]